MPRHVECTSCGLVLLAFEAFGPEPIGHDECPECGEQEYVFAE